MTQAELNRQVANATGETVSTIAQRGFSLVEPEREEHEPLAIDWDELQAARNVAIVEQPNQCRVA